MQDHTNEGQYKKVFNEEELMDIEKAKYIFCKFTLILNLSLLCLNLAVDMSSNEPGLVGSMRG